MLVNTRILSEYHKKIEELGTREARDAWCFRVEQDLGSSVGPNEGKVPPGLLRVRNLETEIMNVVGLVLSSFPPLI